MAVYTLQTTNLSAGTVRVELVTSLASLTIPSFASLNFEGDFIERVDVLAGVAEIENADVTYTEDYSVYDEGFWFKVFANGAAQIIVYLDEGAGEFCFFYGDIDPGATELEERDLTTGQIFRDGSFKLTSMLARIKTVSMASYLTEIGTHFTYTSTIDGTGVTGYQTQFAQSTQIHEVAWFFSCALALAVGQTAGLSDVSCPTDDVQFGYTSDQWTVFADLFTNCTVTWRANPNNTIGDITYLLGDVNIGNRYQNVFDFIAALSKELGLIMRVWYDTGASKHKMLLLTRGRSYANPITLGVPVESKLIIQGLADVTQMESMHATRAEGVYYNTHTEVGQGLSTQPPNWSPDISVFYEIRTGSTNYGHTYRVNAPNDVVTLTHQRFYDYDAAANTPYVGDFFAMLCLYYGRMFRGGKRSYERLYASLKADDTSTNSAQNLTLLRHSVINDDVSNRTYYASEVRRNLTRNEAWVKWTEL